MPHTEGLEEVGSCWPSWGSWPRRWATPVGAEAAGEQVVLLDLPRALGQGGAGRQDPLPRGATGVVGVLLSPIALSHECGAGGRGEKLVGKSCPFLGSLRLMQKVLGKARFHAWGVSHGGSGETWSEAGARWLQGGPQCWPETGLEGGRKLVTEMAVEGDWPGYHHPNYKKCSLIFCSMIFFTPAPMQ